MFGTEFDRLEAENDAFYEAVEDLCDEYLKERIFERIADKMSEMEDE